MPSNKILVGLTTSSAIAGLRLTTDTPTPATMALQLATDQKAADVLKGLLYPSVFDNIGWVCREAFRRDEVVDQVDTVEEQPVDTPVADIPAPAPVPSGPIWACKVCLVLRAHAQYCLGCGSRNHEAADLGLFKAHARPRKHKRKAPKSKPQPELASESKLDPAVTIVVVAPEDHAGFKADAAALVSPSHHDSESEEEDLKKKGPTHPKRRAYLYARPRFPALRGASDTTIKASDYAYSDSSDTAVESESDGSPTLSWSRTPSWSRIASWSRTVSLDSEAGQL